MTFNGCFVYGVEDKYDLLTPFFALASECPFRAIDCMEVALPNPLGVLVGVPPLGPTPEVSPHSAGDVAKGFFADYPSVVGTRNLGESDASFLMTTSCSAPFREQTSLPILLQKSRTFFFEGLMSSFPP